MQITRGSPLLTLSEGSFRQRGDADLETLQFFLREKPLKRCNFEFKRAAAVFGVSVTPATCGHRAAGRVAGQRVRRPGGRADGQAACRWPLTRENSNFGPAFFCLCSHPFESIDRNSCNRSFFLFFFVVGSHPPASLSDITCIHGWWPRYRTNDLCCPILYHATVC